MRNHAISTELLNHDYTYRKLQTEHEVIEKKLETLRASPSLDPTTVTQLKRIKLRLRDEMAAIERRKLH
ncbi:MAG: DUF465 domain-containing protein [Proteobacteria bacterium]|nr:DUF465 domain-containing protein [Pseudomonadota bacterium]